MPVLTSFAELEAEKATTFSSFAINLTDVKRAVEQILGQFGRNRIFAEYTMHDITHINDMLKTLDWMVPELSRKAMSPGDWLLIVLAIYFHDMGLVVTEDEFTRRAETGFPDFCRKVLFAGAKGKDYQEKMGQLEEAERERFMYQDFVRYHHGSRVKQWIAGDSSILLGAAKAQVDEINRLLAGLDPVFRRDVGLVCESHNLDDIDNTSKYKVAQAYGDSEQETVNLQYSAVLLRTVDLIQITRGRAPIILFKLINPTDPVSQAEWAKQQAVRRVRPKAALNREGEADSTVQSDTIEVVAYFKDGEAYFGLTSYLHYAKSQLLYSYNTLRKAKRENTRPYSFPWRMIDDDDIEVEGFEKRPFGFEIDQEKVLNLLTGHTLYNDSDVVLRELVQNAIDAVRLYSFEQQTNSADVGLISVSFDTKKRILTVSDNGTGMTQDIVEQHLLKVGSSRYQEPKFIEKHQEFHSISRFGIGVLSCFMVADTVEIITVSPEEDTARSIKLKSVHGKYLVRKLDKLRDPQVSVLGTHGTLVQVNLRASSSSLNVEDTLRKWIVFPRCKLLLTVDGAAPISIGYHSPRDVLKSYFDQTLAERGHRYEIKEDTIEGITIAYGLKFDRHFRDWNFITYDRTRKNDDRSRPNVPVGICVEGVSVEFETPGFNGLSLICIANTVGKLAPKTNVARSAIEATPERNALYEAIYTMLFNRVQKEVERLNEEAKFSLTWAVEQMPYIASAILNNPKDPDLHATQLNKLPLFIVEEDDVRKAKSLVHLEQANQLWTVDSQLTRSIEQVIREAKAEITATGILRNSQGSAASLPVGAIVTNLGRSELAKNVLGKKFEINKITAYIDERRLDLGWSNRNDRWLDRNFLRRQINQTPAWDGYVAFIQNIGTHQYKTTNVYSPQKEVPCVGLEEYVGIRTQAGVYLLPETPLSNYMVSVAKAEKSGQRKIQDVILALDAIEFISGARFGIPANISGSLEAFFRVARSRLSREWLSTQAEIMSEFSACQRDVRFFDPSAWSIRGDAEVIFDED